MITFQVTLVYTIDDDRFTSDEEESILRDHIKLLPTVTDVSIISFMPAGP